MDYPTSLYTNGAPSRRAEPALVLCFADGQGKTERCRIPTDGLLIGRGETVFSEAFRDPRMSPRHAEVRMAKGCRVVVRDVGSAHGTRLNGETLFGERCLEPGDVLRIGDTILIYTSSTEGAHAEADGLGVSDAMVAVQRSIDAVASRKHTVVVTGETGTGKEVVARQIHDRSGRNGPFIAVNCSTFTEALLPSELFGHVRGAFTGAVTEHPGLFRAARGGTLLLDELAEIPLSLQASLLRVLESQEVRPVGGTKDIAIDVRVVATTNRELMELVRAGKFRADLYARLAQWTIRLPALKARREDIPGLVAKILPRVEGEGRRLSPDLAEALLVHDWPLNVRGLLNALSIAIVSTESREGPLALTHEVQTTLYTTRSIEAEPEKPSVPTATTLDREELEGLMEQFHGHVAAAGRHVGMTRSKLYRLLEAHGLEPGGYRDVTRGVSGQGSRSNAVSRDSQLGNESALGRQSGSERTSEALRQQQSQRALAEGGAK
jgi:DNA-binding NtrC family response regulator